MAKKIIQIRYFGENHPDNYPKNLVRNNLTSQDNFKQLLYNLCDGEAIIKYLKVINKTGVQLFIKHKDNGHVFIMPETSERFEYQMADAGILELKDCNIEAIWFDASFLAVFKYFPSRDENFKDKIEEYESSNSLYYQHDIRAVDTSKVDPYIVIDLCCEINN